MSASIRTHRARKEAPARIRAGFTNNMDISQLQLKLEEMGIEPHVIDEVVGAMQSAPQGGVKQPMSTEALNIMREYETDWRKRAIISAEIVKRGLDT